LQTIAQATRRTLAEMWPSFPVTALSLLRPVTAWCTPPGSGEKFIQKSWIVLVALCLSSGGSFGDSTRTTGDERQCKQFSQPQLCGEPALELPAAVAAYARRVADDCTQVGGRPLAGPKIEHGQFSEGPEFWTVDDATLACEGAWSLYSNPHGWDIAIFFASPDEQVRKFTVRAGFGLKIERDDNSAKVWASLSGMNCGQKPARSTAEEIGCERALVWDAKARKINFAPMSQARAHVNSKGEAAAPQDTSSLPRTTDAAPPSSYQPAIHNGSQMQLSTWQDGTVEIAYATPRPGLSVNKGTLLFHGVAKGTHYSGTAYTFKSGCPPAPYPVTGVRNDKRQFLMLTGAAPSRDPLSCDVVAASRQSKHATLIFDVRIDGDE
jgi:hypothetical protein